MRLLEADPEVMRFTPSRVPQSEEQTRGRLAGQIARTDALTPFGIWLAESTDKAFVGWFMLVPAGDAQLELGFMIERSAAGKGFATEVGRALVAFAFSDPSITALTARTDEDNEPSQRVLVKLGFRYVDTVSAPDKVLGREVRTKRYELARNP